MNENLPIDLPIRIELGSASESILKDFIDSLPDENLIDHQQLLNYPAGRDSIQRPESDGWTLMRLHRCNNRDDASKMYCRYAEACDACRTETKLMVQFHLELHDWIQ